VSNNLAEPLKGLYPRISSRKVTPRENISAFLPQKGLLSSISGAL
jgi:hypothetical protein